MHCQWEAIQSLFETN